MRKRWFLIGIIFLLLPWGMVGCWVAQEDYDALMVEYDGMRVRVESAESDLVGTQAKNSELTSSLEGSQTELEGVKDELAAAQTKNSELTSSLEGTQKELEGAKGELATAQAKNSELTSSLEKSQTELEAIKTENQDLEQANTKLKRLIFLKTALCSEQPEAWKPKPKPDNTFKTNEEVWVYAEFTGWKYILVDQEIKRNIKVTIDILDFTGGKVVESKSWTYTEKQELPYSRSGFDRRFGSLEVGNYTVEVEVMDINSGETITWEEEFKVV